MGNFADTIANDFAMMDNAESVTYTLVGSVLPPVAAAIPFAIRQPIRNAQRSPTGGVYLAFEQEWLLPGKALQPLTLGGGRTPQPADTILDADGTTWTVLRVERDTWTGWYTLGCIDLVLAYALRDTATVWAPTNTQDAAGSRRPTFTQVGLAIAARFQLTGEEMEESRGKQLWKRTYRVFLASEVTVSTEHQVRDGSGNEYAVQSYENRGRIEELSVATCVRYSDS